MHTANHLSTQRSILSKPVSRSTRCSLLLLLLQFLVAAAMTPIAKSFYDLSATDLQGEKVDFNNFRGRVVLIENVASL